MKPISLALHGGAGTILRAEMPAEREARYKAALKAALDLGYAVLEKGGSALDAVETTVISLENTPLFNAGKGSVFNARGAHEMDAAIMDGSNLNAGSVALVTGVRNPVSLARQVMERTEHVFLAGEGAMEFARSIHIAFESPEYFHDAFRYEQWQKAKAEGKVQLDHAVDDKKFGTVGAVALDRDGNLAAATSTGGMTNKSFGRVGDTPMIGAGTYANNKSCAISCTGSGEFFIRTVVAYDIHCLMQYKGLSLEEACRVAVQEHLLDIGGDGGLIAVDAKGNITLPFNTEGMYRAWKGGGGEGVEIYK